MSRFYLLKVFSLLRKQQDLQINSIKIINFAIQNKDFHGKKKEASTLVRKHTN